MSRESVADALDRAAEAIAQAAHELRGTEQPEAGVVPPSAPAPAAPLPPKRQLEESAFTECPAHRQPFKEGKFGLFCSGHEPEGVPHDGGWYNDKGYCRVTPKSAGAWLKQHPNGPVQGPVEQPEDVDDLPF